MEQLKKREVAVVGGGISGLAVAYFLKPYCNITILESKPILGGVIQTKTNSGYLLEYGPNTTRTTVELEELINELNLQNEVVTPPSSISKKRYLARRTTKGITIISTPSSLLEAIKTPLLSMREKIRALAEIFIRQETIAQETVYSFISRRFGPAVAEKLVAAIVSGIWAGDIKTMEAASGLPKLVALEREFGSIIRGGISSKKSKHKSRVISFKKGMVQLTQALASNLSDCKSFTSIKLKPISKTLDGKIKVESTEGDLLFDQIILTQDAQSASELLSLVAPELASKINKIPYAPLGVVHLGFKKSSITHPLDGFGFLVPPIYSDGVLGCIFNSSMFPNRAPEDHQLLTIFAGGAVFPKIADVEDDLNFDLILKSIKEALSITNEPSFIERTFLPKAIPNYIKGHQELSNSLCKFCDENNNISILANWKSGVSVADRISCAKELANSLIGKIASQ